MMKVWSLKGLALAAISGLVVMGSLAGAGAALAASDDALLEDPSGTPGPFGGMRGQAQENFYQRLQLVVQEQQLRLDLANQIAAATEDWIEAQKAEGKDTSVVETALATFKAKIDAAQSEHDEAAGILNAHAGFDDAGKVTDPEQAHETLSGTREHLRAAHLSLREGTRALREAAKDFRKANRPEKPAATEPQ